MLNKDKNTRYQITTQDQYRVMPWKNGLGFTREIFVSSDEKGIRFRISQASVVETGAFSDFSGLTRTLVLLKGEGMTLAHSAAGKLSTRVQHLTNPLDIAQFEGGDTTIATLIDGSIEDLNIMNRKGDTQAYVQRYQSPTPLNIKQTDNILFTGFYANSDTIVNISTLDLSTPSEQMLLTSQSLLTLSSSQHADLVNGTGVLIQIAAIES